MLMPVCSSFIKAGDDVGRQLNKLYKAFVDDYMAICKIWMERPPFRVLLDYIEEFPEIEEAFRAKKAHHRSSGSLSTPGVQAPLQLRVVGKARLCTCLRETVSD